MSSEDRIYRDFVKRMIYTEGKVRRYYLKFIKQENPDEFAKKVEKVNQPEAIIKISPEKIEYELLKVDHWRFKRQYNFSFKNHNKKRYNDGKYYGKAGCVIPGSWDKKGNKFQANHIYTALKKRFSEGKDWKDTSFYLRFLDKNSSRNWKSYRKEKLGKYEELYKEIKLNGYKSQKEIDNRISSQDEREGSAVNEIEVAVGRDGEIYFLDGRHRLALAKIMNIERIPVIVNVWHEKFVERVSREIDVKNPSPRQLSEFL